MALPLLQALYREERLSVRKREDRKRALGTRAPAAVPQEPTSAEPRLRLRHARRRARFRILVVVDDRTRECSCAGGRHVAVRRRVTRANSTDHPGRGKPLMIVSDNGTESDLARHPALAGRACGRVALHRPRQAAAERLRRKLERALARRVLERASVPEPAGGPDHHRGVAGDYNTCRPHTSLGGLTPNAFATRSKQDQNRTDSGYERGQTGGKVRAILGQELL